MSSPFGGFEGWQAVGEPARIVPQGFRICAGKVHAVAAEFAVPDENVDIVDLLLYALTL